MGTNSDMLSIRVLGINVSKLFMEIQTFSLKNMRLKMSSVTYWLDLNVFVYRQFVILCFSARSIALLYLIQYRSVFIWAMFFQHLSFRGYSSFEIQMSMNKDRFENTHFGKPLPGKIYFWIYLHGNQLSWRLNEYIQENCQEPSFDNLHGMQFIYLSNNEHTCYAISNNRNAYAEKTHKTFIVRDVLTPA